MMVGFHCQLVLFCYESSVMVSFVGLRDLNDGRFYSVTRFQYHLALFLKEILMTVGFVPLRDFNDSYEISMMVGFQCQLVLFCYEISKTSVLFGYEISVMVGFVPLQDFNDCWVYSVTSFQ